MSLSATQQLKLEGAKMGLHESGSRFAGLSSDHGFEGSEKSSLSSHSSPSHPFDFSAGILPQKIQDEFLATSSCNLPSTSQDGAKDGKISPVRPQPGVDAISGILFHQMQVRVAALFHDFCAQFV